VGITSVAKTGAVTMWIPPFASISVRKAGTLSWKIILLSWITLLTFIFPAMKSTCQEAESKPVQAVLPAIRPSELTGWLYLGRIDESGQWASDSPKNVASAPLTLDKGAILTIKNEAYLHQDSEPLKHASAPVLVVLSTGQTVEVVAKDHSSALVGGNFVWAKVRQIDNAKTNNAETPLATILLQGESPLDDLGKLFEALRKNSLLPVRLQDRGDGQTLADIYASALHLSSITPALLHAAEYLNKDPTSLSSSELSTESSGIIVIPDVELSPYQAIVKCDPAESHVQSVCSHVLEHQSNIRLGNSNSDSSSEQSNTVRLTLTGYKLQFHLQDPEQINALIDVVRDLKSPDIQILNQRLTVAAQALSFKVKFEGAYPDDFNAVLSILLRHKLIGVATRPIKRGETLEQVYKEELNLPVAPTGMPLRLNPNITTTNNIPVGTPVAYPDVKFVTYVWTKYPTDPRSTAAVNQKWGLIIRNVSHDGDRVRWDVEGYLLEVYARSSADMQKARRALAQVSSANVILVFPNADAKHDFYAISSGENGTLFWENRVLTKPHRADLGIQGLIGSYANMSDMSRVTQNCVAENCPEVVLIDMAIEPHPDVSAAIVAEHPIITPAPIDAVDNKQILEPGSALTSDHGTGMAGIIAAQDNDFGFIGINPYARLVSFDVSNFDTDPDSVAQTIQSRLRTKESVYVMATEWTLSIKKGPAKSTNASRITTNLSDSTIRFQDVIARKIRDSKPLFIGSAGEEREDGAPSRDLTFDYPKAPMDLGDLGNVVIVTACINCYTPGATIMPTVNYSTSGLVALAAPGSTIPTTIHSNMYGLMSGASPATAIVAGIASAMIGKFPLYFARSSERVRFWLEVTSRPFENDDGEKVQAGILDANVALRDPQQSYKSTGRDDLSPFKPVRWCSETVILIDRNGRKVPVSASEIYRLVRLKSSPSEWMIYISSDPTKGILEKRGPGKIRLPIDNRNLMMTMNSAGVEIPYTLEDVSDILLSPAQELKDPGVCK
jgi:Subtilase family